MKAMTPSQDRRLTLPPVREEFGACHRDGKRSKSASRRQSASRLDAGPITTA